MSSFDRFEDVELAAVQDGAVFMMMMRRMICRTVDFNCLFCSRQFNHSFHYNDTSTTSHPWALLRADCG
ncbi:hypothetical protein T4A_10730 [Trichinella pseudospiralis]|uniref:Uncharacterized protein n=1 Tax=Trichinella pseudospiralis TaxID=6337 RepID=A0A0V1JTD4_TRIPS|nr:hypothetical protein T4E_10023 [Trichinella pseudospiralis]KRY70890.1 hypothetical protein T4A_10730 [Trichinella pseudospiralis]KRZ38233.1 hypothetical protein T4C_7751 [Trichinella pseudospiralis]